MYLRDLRCPHDLPRSHHICIRTSSRCPGARAHVSSLLIGWFHRTGKARPIRRLEPCSAANQHLPCDRRAWRRARARVDRRVTRPVKSPCFARSLMPRAFYTVQLSRLLFICYLEEGGNDLEVEGCKDFASWGLKSEQKHFEWLFSGKRAFNSILLIKVRIPIVLGENSEIATQCHFEVWGFHIQTGVGVLTKKR